MARYTAFRCVGRAAGQGPGVLRAAELRERGEEAGYSCRAFESSVAPRVRSDSLALLYTLLLRYLASTCVHPSHPCSIQFQAAG